MRITIDYNTTDVMTELERQVLLALTGAVIPAPTPAVEVHKADAAAAQAKAKPGPKPKPEVVSSIKTQEQVDAEPEAEVAAEAAAPVDLSVAVARATALVSEGKSTEVKAALTAVGAKRVSELSEDQVASFLAALES